MLRRHLPVVLHGPFLDALVRLNMPRRHVLGHIMPHGDVVYGGSVPCHADVVKRGPLLRHVVRRCRYPMRVVLVHLLRLREAGKAAVNVAIAYIPVRSPPQWRRKRAVYISQFKDMP